MQTGSSTEQQMRPDAANPVQVAAAATLPLPGAEQQLAGLFDDAECIDPGSTGLATALQLMHRAASMPPSEAESPRSDAAGEYCMRLVSKNFHQECTVCLWEWPYPRPQNMTAEPSVSPPACTYDTQPRSCCSVGLSHMDLNSTLFAPHHMCWL